MLNVFFSIRKCRNARALASSAVSRPACPLQQPSPSQTPIDSARVNYDIPTYIRRGIKLSGIDGLR
jgi:hypothetical protein